jgi:hypothetical protein
MSLWRQLTYGLRSLAHRAKRDQDVADEVEQYFQEATAACQTSPSVNVKPMEKLNLLAPGGHFASCLDNR